MKSVCAAVFIALGLAGGGFACTLVASPTALAVDNQGTTWLNPNTPTAGTIPLTISGCPTWTAAVSGYQYTTLNGSGGTSLANWFALQFRLTPVNTISSPAMPVTGGVPSGTGYCSPSLGTGGANGDLSVTGGGTETITVGVCPNPTQANVSTVSVRAKHLPI